MRSRTVLLAVPFVVGASLGLVACGDDDDAGGTTTPAGQITNPAVLNTALVNPTTGNGGGGMSAGAPSFTSFDVSNSVPCESGNATATMSFETMNVVSIEIKIGDGEFESTAGYGPNESDVVASIPCSGAGESSIQLRGCTEDNDCADSESKKVTITG